MNLQCKICGKKGGHTLRFHVQEVHGYGDPELAYKQLVEVEEE